MITINQAPLKAVFFIHFILSVWAMQAGWLAPAYPYYNAIFLLVIIWGLHSAEADEPVFMAVTINMVSIVLDCVCIGVRYSDTDVFGSLPGSDSRKFSLAMAIINLLFRPMTSFILSRLYMERSGRYSDFGFAGGRGFQQGPYEDIDHPAAPQSVPKTSMDTGSPVHDHYSVP